MLESLALPPRIPIGSDVSVAEKLQSAGANIGAVCLLIGSCFSLRWFGRHHPLFRDATWLQSAAITSAVVIGITLLLYVMHVYAVAYDTQDSTRKVKKNKSD